MRLDPDNIGFLEYIKKADERLQRIKSEALEKMERRIAFTDLDEVGFDQHSVKVPIIEMHLDKKEIEALQQKKEQVVNRQKQEVKIVEGRNEAIEELEKGAGVEEAGGAKKKNKKKNKKSKKNKGLSAFMDEDEMDKYNNSAAAENDDK